jgi:hypothetical protein
MDRRTRDGAVGRQWRLQHGQNSHLRSHRGGIRRHLMVLQTARWVLERLTEDCTGRIVTGETGLAHTRTSNRQLMSRCPPCLSRCCEEFVAALRGRGRGQRGQPLRSRDGQSYDSGDELTHCR